MTLQVHDVLVLECPVEGLIQTAALVQQVMADAYALLVPLQTEARYGFSVVLRSIEIMNAG